MKIGVGKAVLLLRPQVKFNFRVPLKGIIAFWNYGTPEYNLRTASNLQPFCKYRNDNTTKSHPNFRLTPFTVERDFYLLLEETHSLVMLCSWEQRAGVRIVVDMGIVREMTTRMWDMLCLCVASTDGSQAISELYENISGSVIKETDEFSRDYRQWDEMFWLCIVFMCYKYR